MPQRLKNTFASSRKTFIPYMMAGDPDTATAQEFLNQLPKAGADIIEIGMPFSDPMADGPTIEAAGRRALAKGMNLHGVLDMVTAFRRKNADTALILMGYYNPIYRYGTEAFCRDAAAAGVDGLLIADIPPEEEEELAAPMQRSKLDLIRLVTPTTPPERIPLIVQRAGGFLYYVSIKGSTGSKNVDTTSLARPIAEIRRFSDLPIAVGFGIKTPAQAAEAAQTADGIVVGSALVQELHENGLEAALKLAGDLATAIKKS